MDGAPIISGSKASEVLKAVETPLDPVAAFVGTGVMGDGDLAGPIGGDDSFCAHLGDNGPQLIAIIGFVGDDSSALLIFEKGLSLGYVTDLPSRQDKAHGAAQRIGKHMDFGCQPTSGTPQRLVFGPPFPVAALPGCLRLKRRCAVFHLP